MCNESLLKANNHSDCSSSKMEDCSMNPIRLEIHI